MKTLIFTSILFLTFSCGISNKIDITKYIGHLFSEGGVSLPKVTFSNKENEEIPRSKGESSSKCQTKVE